MLTDYHTPLCLHAEGNPVDYARHAQMIGPASESIKVPARSKK